MTEFVAYLRRHAVALAGVAVVVAAGAATAHGLFEVAVGSRVPPGIAWLYPAITDGLALVAYAATTRLTGPARWYAWGVVVLAAGLSGYAQAVYLGGAVDQAPPEVRYGVGAWPAVAAAIAAHLLFLISEADRRPTGSQTTVDQPPPGADRPLTSADDDDTLVADLRGLPGGVPSRDRVRALYGVGSTRADRLIERAGGPDQVAAGGAR